MGIVLNKLIDGANVNMIFDTEQHRNLLDITVLVIDSWI